MIFTGGWVSYMLRVNTSLSIIAMMQPPINTTQGINETQPVIHEERFNWTQKEKALILGAYFWSYPITSFIGGTITERFGPRYVVLFCQSISVLLTAIGPIVSRWHFGGLITSRFLLGAAGGVIYPSFHVLVARWSPPAEKGKFTSGTTMGGTLGTIVTWSLTGILIEHYGWPSSFYVPAALTVIWCFFWWYLVADTPDDHPRIAESERNYIKEALGNSVKKSKGFPPFKHIALSLPFISMIVLHFGNLWGLYFILTVGPTYISTVLGFKLAATGVVTSLPNLARLICSGLFGLIGDFIVSRKFISTKMIRKSFCTFSHIMPGLLLIVLVYWGYVSTTTSVALLTLSMGLNGAATLTNLQNHQDLSPNYAGTLYGIANSIGSSAGFFTPMITAYFTRDGSSFKEWRPVFIIGGLVYITTAIFFIIFGTASIQPWNDMSNYSKEKKDDDKKINVKGTPMSIITK